MKEAIIHLIVKHGRKKIIFLRGPINHEGSQIRFQAYLDALSENGLPYDEILISDPNENWDGETMVSQILDRNNIAFDALAAVSGYVARGAVKQLRSRGFSVPEDIAVIEFDDDYQNINSQSSITALHPSFYDIGKRSVEVIVDRIKEKPVSSIEQFSTHLIIRESCGCTFENMLDSYCSEYLNVYILSARAELKNSTLDSFFIEKISILVDLRHEKGKTIIRQIWEHLTSELQSNSNSFITFFKNVVYNSTQNGVESHNWLILIYIFKQYIRRSIYLNPDQQEKMDELFLKIMIMINDVSGRIQTQGKIKDDELKNILLKDEISLITSFDIDEIITTVKTVLHKLGVLTCYLVLYENSNKPLDKARLLLAYTNGISSTLPENGMAFSTMKLLPDLFWDKTTRFENVVLSLFSQNEQIGYVLFGICEIKNSFYETLRNELSISLKGAMLALELLESEEKYRLLFESSSDASILFDFESGVTVDANESALRLYECKKDSFIGNINIGNLLDEFKLSLSSLEEKRICKFPLCWHKNKEGVSIPLELIIGNFSIKGVRKGFIVLRDINDSIEYNIKQSQIIERMQNLFEDVKYFSDFVTRDKFSVRPEKAPCEFGITAQEEKITYFIVQGLRNKEIALKLFISENTVKGHITSILSKFNASNRAELLSIIKRDNVLFSFKD